MLQTVLNGLCESGLLHSGFPGGCTWRLSSVAGEATK